MYNIVNIAQFLKFLIFQELVASNPEPRNWRANVISVNIYSITNIVPDHCCSGDGDPLCADRGWSECGAHDAPWRRPQGHGGEDQAGWHPGE